MRTTVNIDDDVIFAVKERAQRERRTAGEVLSELARMALTNRKDWEGESDAEEPDIHGFVPLPRRGAAVSNALIDRLREEELD